MKKPYVFLDPSVAEIFTKAKKNCAELCRPQSLRFFLLSRMVFLGFAVFIAILATTTMLYERLIDRQARFTSASFAQQAYATINNLMLRGPSRQELLQTISDFKTAQQDSPYRLEIFRGALVEKDYGSIVQPPIDEAVRQVFASGRPETRKNPEATRYIYPLIAEANCLRCHPSVKLGATLGAVEVSQNIAVLTARMRNESIWIFFAYGFMTLLFAGFVSWRVTAKVSAAIRKFQQHTSSIQSVSDLQAIGLLGKTDMGFLEFNQSVQALSELAQRLQTIAVDKDILEFEIKLLNKFVITSDVVKDWTTFIKELLVDINTIIDTTAIVAFFRDQGLEDAYTLDIFWRSAPPKSVQAGMENMVKEQLSGSFRLDQETSLIRVTHHVSNNGLPLARDFTVAEIDLHTKSIFLEHPKVGGVVGLGVCSSLVTDPIYHLVLSSILSTLMNLVGSLKAISYYTRDLEYFATRDPLTGLHNRRMFMELLNYETSRATRHEYPFCLLFIDMDNFKTINDRFGHTVGDNYLKKFAEMIRANVREGDFVARYGGDEFTVLLPETTTEQANEMASRILRATAAMNIPSPTGNVTINGTISIGIALFPENGRTAEELVQLADSMMYKVKGEGKNAVAVAEPAKTGAFLKNKKRIVSMLYEAVEQKSPVPFFQPIVDLSAGTILAHELLMRIPEADGFMAAGMFIETAEELGLIHALDLIVLEKACAAMRDTAYSGKLFVNISPKNFVVSRFASTFHAIVTGHGINPGQIVLEITERETTRDISELQHFIFRMHKLGYLLAIDDFGSGYSSFRYLQIFPIDYLKIEGEFIRKIHCDSECRALVKSIVFLAKDLKIKTVAECIEKKSYVRTLRSLGIDYGQGYHMGRPVPELTPAQSIMLPPPRGDEKHDHRRTASTIRRQNPGEKILEPNEGGEPPFPVS